MVNIAVWAVGKDVEAIAFTLSMIASSFFGLPHLAEFISPARKPVRHMTHAELIDLVRTSHPKDEWSGISKSWVSEYFFNEDPRLRFHALHREEGVQCQDFKEDWANCHPDPHATGYWHDLFYDGNLIERFILVSVDGGRATLPLPDIGTRKVKPLNYKVAQIHDVLGTLDQYLVRSGLKLDTE